jgi:hypothetical protein
VSGGSDRGRSPECVNRRSGSVTARACSSSGCLSPSDESGGAVGGFRDLDSA